jgi:glycosyltransferase involved in cell wall biosynthesis
MKSNAGSKQPTREILVVGPFPPPFHGFAQATEDMAARLQAQGFRVTRIDLAPIRNKDRALSSLGVRLSQFASLISAVWRGSRVYVGLSGGVRQAIDLVFLAIGRLGGACIYVHHHSFAYLNRPTWLARMSVFVAGPSATHIVLCDGMKRALQGRYRSVRNIETFSNAGLPSVCQHFTQRQAVQTIGYLGWLTKEKGILEFLSTSKLLAREHADLSFRVAGPCFDATILEELAEARRAFPCIDYVGPVSGKDKNVFIRSLDVLLFPTTYAHEAEPLVILEAMSSGIPVIGWERGCLGEMLAAGGAEPDVIPRTSPFAAAAVAKVEEWLAVPAIFRRRSAEVRTQFEQMARESAETFDCIFRVMQ